MNLRLRLIAAAGTFVFAGACSNSGVLTGGGGGGNHKGVILNPLSNATTESGTQATFSIVLADKPGHDVTLHFESSDTTEGLVNTTSMTFTSTNWNAPQTVVCTGVDDSIDDGDQLWRVHFLPSVTQDNDYAQIVPSDVPVTNVDDETAGISVSAVSGATREDGTQSTFAVHLNSQPTSDVTVSLDSSDATEGTVDQTTLTFTAANWNAPQTITVTGQDDPIADGDMPYTIVFLPTTSNDPKYNGMTPLPLPMTNVDDETPGVLVSSASGPTTEAGGTATFTVVLTSQPSAQVNVHFDTNDAGEGTPDVTTLPFTTANWNVPQTVTVTGQNDDAADGNQPYAIVFTATTSADTQYAGITPANVPMVNLDDETAGIVVSAISGPTTEAGGTATFTVVLQSQPTSGVSLSFVSSKPLEGTVSQSSVSFTTGNWNVPQPVTVTGQDDDVADGNQPYAIVFNPSTSADGAYNGITPANVAVTNLDDDSVGIRVSAISGPTTEGAGTATFTVVLTSQPGATVTVPFDTDDATEGTPDVTSLDFTTGNWNVPQTVTVTGVDDDVADGNIAYAIAFTPSTSLDGAYAGITPAQVNVTNVDDDSAGIDVSAISGPTTEAGGTATFTIVLTSQPTADVTVNFDSDDATEGTLSGVTSATFTSGNWSVPQTITVTGVPDGTVDGDVPYHIAFTATASGDGAYAAILPASVNVTNLDVDVAPTPTPTPSPTATPEGCANGGWASKAAMPAARRVPGVAANDGLVYVAGGQAATDTSTLYAWNPRTDAWSTLASMPAGRYEPDGAAFLNGKMYVVGGWTTSPGLPHSDVFVYDPVANSWSSAASMSHLAACGAVGVINGKLYASTSCNGFSGYSNYFEVYDPSTNAWSTLPSPPHTHGEMPGAGVISGKLYLVGGVDAAGASQPGYLDVYDPVSNSWTTKASMPTSRWGTRAEAHDGRLYVAGGYDGATNVSTVEVYDPATDTWTTDTPLLAPRQGEGMALVDGQIVVVGGSDATNLDTTEAFTPCPAGNWVAKASFSFNSSTPGAGVWQGKIDVFGGYGTTYLNDHDQYDASMDSWTPMATMPTTRDLLGYATVNGIMYAIGGSLPGACTNVVEAYDPATNTWTSKASMSTARCGPGVAVLDGKIYAMGGQMTSGTPLPSMEVYDPVANSWSTLASMANARGQLGAAAVDGKIYAVGGYDGSNVPTVEVYDPIANSWSAGVPMQHARASFGVVARDGKVWAMGGSDGSVFVATTEYFDPGTGVWSFGPAMLKPRVGLAAVVLDDTIYVIGGNDGTGGIATMEALAP